MRNPPQPVKERILNAVESIVKPRGCQGRGNALPEGLFDGLLRLGNQQVETPLSRRRHTREETDTPI